MHHNVLLSFFIKKVLLVLCFHHSHDLIQGNWVVQDALRVVHTQADVWVILHNELVPIYYIKVNIVNKWLLNFWSWRHFLIFLLVFFLILFYDKNWEILFQISFLQHASLSSHISLEILLKHLLCFLLLPLLTDALRRLIFLSHLCKLQFYVLLNLIICNFNFFWATIVAFHWFNLLGHKIFEELNSLSIPLKFLLTFFCPLFFSLLTLNFSTFSISLEWVFIFLLNRLLLPL